MKVIDSETTVDTFLKHTRAILTDDKFDINRNFYIIPVRHSSGDERNKTTMLDLNYTATDIVTEILSLTVEHYKETVIDNMPNKTNNFYCFVKYIIKNQVYIKFKISDVKDRQVFCVSFHYVDFPVAESEFPYKK